jgi:hypothetical protein
VMVTSRCTCGRGGSGRWGGRLLISVPIHTWVTVVVIKASVALAVSSVSVAILMVGACLTGGGGHDWTRRAVSGRRLHVKDNTANRFQVVNWVEKKQTECV